MELPGSLLAVAIATIDLLSLLEHRKNERVWILFEQTITVVMKLTKQNPRILKTNTNTLHFLAKTLHQLHHHHA